MQAETGSVVNRTEHSAFMSALEQEVAQSNHGGEPMGLLLVQLRDLSRLNVTLGYEGGDRVLSELATRLAAGFGPRARVMRIGARKFALTLRGLKGGEHALLAARKVEQIADAPIEIAGRNVPVPVTQGLALCPDHGTSAAELMRHAEAALANAGESDSSISLYDGSETTRIRASMLIEEVVLDALGEGLVEAWFQPQVSIADGRVLGAEALLRCRGWDGEWLAPDDVIAAATRLRRMDDLTGVMLHAALRRTAEWHAERFPLRASVNISAVTLRKPDLVEQIADALNVWSVAAPDLTIELTESVFIHHPEQSFETMRRLRELGVRVAIDDFGTGYSSLAYFRDIPANELKVDKSFVIGMLADSASRRIVQAVVDLAHAFDLEVVAEGVEDQATLGALAAMGCDLAQGYLVARPMPADDFLRWLVTRRA
jgi:diguanylate cyclase (GGDEF)-like protein